MNNPATIKRRKKLRHARNKRKAMRYHNYLHSPQWEEDFKNAVKEFNKHNRPLDEPIEL